MKIGLAQINPVVGDFPANVKRILAGYRECLEAGAELVIAPELALAGYPPRDLVFKSQFEPKCRQALDYLAGEIGEVPLLVGFSVPRFSVPASNTVSRLVKQTMVPPLSPLVTYVQLAPSLSET